MDTLKKTKITLPIIVLLNCQKKKKKTRILIDYKHFFDGWCDGSDI